jgi:hypothetical protein
VEKYIDELPHFSSKKPAEEEGKNASHSNGCCHSHIGPVQPSCLTGYEKEPNKEVNSLGAHILAAAKGCPYEAASLAIHGG